MNFITLRTNVVDKLRRNLILKHDYMKKTLYFTLAVVMLAFTVIFTVSTITEYYNLYGARLLFGASIAFHLWIFAISKVLRLNNESNLETQKD